MFLRGYILVDLASLFCLFDSYHLFLSRRADVTPYCVNIFTYYISEDKFFPLLLTIVFYLILIRIVAAYLKYVILSADMIVIIAAEALLNSADAVIELILIYLAVLYYSGVDNSVSLFGVCEFKYYR